VSDALTTDNDMAGIVPAMFVYDGPADHGERHGSAPARAEPPYTMSGKPFAKALAIRYMLMP
jgi:hypothetical protein